MNPKTLDQIFTGRRRRQTPVVAQFPGGTSGLLTAYRIFPPNTLGDYTAHPVTWINGRWEHSQLAKSFPVSGSRPVQVVK